MRASLRTIAVLLFVVLSVAAVLLPAVPVRADPALGNNGDGTSTAYWNFTNPADYARAGTQLSGGAVSLQQATSWWNSTTQADFQGAASTTNIDLNRWPGTVDLANTAGTPQTLTLQPSAATGQDAYVNGTAGSRTTNYGTATQMVLDHVGGNEMRPVIRFDVSSLPANSVIDGASLQLYLYQGIGGSFVSEVHYLTTAWNEGTVTWNTPWTLNGGDYPAYVASQTTLTNAAGSYSWNVTQLIDLWYRGRLANDGMILLAPNQASSALKLFYSSDFNTNPTLRPKLVINYRVLGASGAYVSKVGGPAALANWDTISWNVTSQSLVSDEFSGTTLNPKWSWVPPPATTPTYDVGITTPGSLRVNSSTGVDLWSASFTGNVLVQPVVGNFTAIMKFRPNTINANYQKTGLMVYDNNRNWYSVGETYVAATSSVNWAVTSTEDAVSTSRANASNGNPTWAYVQIVRSGNTFTASTSPDGATWTSQYNFAPTVEYPVEARIAFFATDGRSGTRIRPDVDYLRVTFPSGPSVTVTTQIGNTNPPTGPWSPPYANPLGSLMSGTASYVQFHLNFTMGTPSPWLSPGQTPAIGDVNLSWSNFVSSGTVTTNDLVPADLASWGTFNVAQTLNGETIAYAYSLDSGLTWTAVAPGTSLAGVSIASGRIRFRATLSTANSVLTPILTQMSLSYTHTLDHFYVTASASAAAGASFTVSVTAKDASNTTVTSWTGTVSLAARLSDGVTPGGGVLGTISVDVTVGGTTTLTAETYTRAETIRILASNGTATGLSGNVAVAPGPLSSVTVTPGNVTLLLLDTQGFSAQGYDAYGNAIAGLSFAWSVTGGVGTLNASAGTDVTFTARGLGNGTVEATNAGHTGAAQVHVVTGTRPWLDFLAPTAGAWLTGITILRYTNSTDAVSVDFSFNTGSGWTLIGTPGALNGTYAWDTRGLNFTGGSLRALITNNRTVTNTTTLTPIGVDNSPPTIALGPVADYQSTNGTLLILYSTSADTVRIDFSYYDGSWHTIGSTTSLTGSYLWTPGTSINGVTVWAVATDRVGLMGSDQEMGVGRIVGTNPPTLAAIPTIHVSVTAAYRLNLTFYVSDPDTPLANLAVWDADAANVSAAPGPYPSLSIAYATAGTYRVTLWVSDGTSTAWTILTVVASSNQPPVLLRALPTVTFDENTVRYGGLPPTVASFFSDPDGDPLGVAVLGATSILTRLNGNGTMDFWAPTYWHGQESLRVRATDPSGGFAEGGFLVVVRWVDQPPVLDALPALTLNASESRTLDLTSYLHDIDTPLAFLNVSVDCPYVTVQGHTLLLNFPANWTGTGFNVTISDGYRTATQPVAVTLVIPPPPPAWWQAPYVLAIPPIGLLVVVAMFVQRQRWRPTKAFLVDERGQLLREFTLDPSCDVTYEQAVQAGALDAVEKDVRVSKYHARAVHGDVLSLIMLAIGPANVQEVEFARGILVNIQDKFEDRVIARLDEARAQEADVQTATQQMELDRADLQTRARVFGEAVNAVTVARTKLDAETRALQAQNSELVRRETLVQQDRQSLDDLARQLEELRSDLEGKRAELAEREREAESTAHALTEREGALAPKEAELAERDTALATTEADLQERGDTLAAAESKLTSDIVAYHEKAQALKQQDEELAQERKALDDLTLQVQQQETDLKTRAAEIEARETEASTLADALKAKEAELTPREERLSAHEAAVATREASQEERAKTLAAQEAALATRADALGTAEADLASRAGDLVLERRAVDDLARKTQEERTALEARAADLTQEEATILTKTRDLEDLRANLGPRESTLLQREHDLEAKAKALADEEAAFQSRQDLVAAKALEIQQQMESIREREEALARDRTLLENAHGALESSRRELEANVTAFERDMERRKGDLQDQESTVGEARMRLTKDREDFESAKAEKSQFIASKEIELEAREQSLVDRAAEIRTQAEENATHLSELAAREETLEIESSKLDKARAELESRRAELSALGKDHEAKVARFRDEEARKGEELRTWQTTLESEQALLKEQKETFEKEMLDIRESWAGRMLRVEQREEELKEREAKVQADVEWVGRNEADLSKREKTAAENLRVAKELKAEGERLRQELEQRALEVESRERSVREEAAEQSVELQKRIESIQAMEADFAGKKAQSERELATLTQKLKEREAELLDRTRGLDAQEADLASREATLVTHQEGHRKDEERLARERLDVQMLEKQLEARQLELTQDRERLDAESLRLRSEADALRQSLAAKEADLNSERERLERESAALQEKLGTKAKEMATREKAVAAREDELRAEEQDLEARILEIESRERQAEARLAEDAAQQQALARNEQQLKVRTAQFDETVRQFEAEAAAKRREWESLQLGLKSQEAQIAASAESRQAEIAKRMEDLEQRERSLNATTTQLQLERSRIEAQAKNQIAKQAELDAAASRADKRFAELKSMEEDVLKARQAFESEKAGWSARRGEELKQLEATRDAAAEQVQQSERLIEDAQRRTYIAAEAEKAAKRQTEELAAAQRELDRRRVDAENAEKDLETQMAQLREASQKLASKEVELASRTKNLEAQQARATTMEQQALALSEEQKGRKAMLEKEGERLGTLAAELDKRKAEEETRRGAVEGRLAEVTKREQILSTELQRADNLMEDLNRKEVELLAREKGLSSSEEGLMKREEALARRDAELGQGMQALDRMRREIESRVDKTDEDHRAAAQDRKEAEGVAADAEKMKAQAEAMQAEVSKNMRFLQKKALDVLDREEKIRARALKAEEESRVLESRAQILEQKEKALEAEREELVAKLDRTKQDNEKLKAKLAEAEKAGQSTIDMDEWKRDIENRVKIIQRKALDLLDREEKLRKREEELKALAAQLGTQVSP